MSAKIVLQDAYKQFTLDQDKILAPEETVKRFKAKLKKLGLNILEQTVRIDNGRLDIPVFFSLCGSDAVSVIGTQKQMGKGATPAQAEASAVMELAERYSFFSFVNNPRHFFTDTYQNIKEKKIPFELIARSVHDDSGDLEISRTIFENIPLQWTPAFNLTRNEPLLIPFNWFFTINEFNGPSAGNCIEEAILQGICEVVERHVCSLVSQKQIRVAAIDPQSATDPMVHDMLVKYRKNGIRLFVSDFSLGTGIPSVGVLAYDPATFPELSEIVWTAGTTPDPEKALSRALTEVAQLAGDFNSSANYVASGLPKPKSLDAVSYITAPGQTIPLADLPDLSDANIKTEIEKSVNQLARNHMEVILINTTHDLLQVPAFYTIIPGAHFRERARGTSVAMFAAKIITETEPPQKAIPELKKMETLVPGKYYLRFYLGNCHLNLGDPQTAARCFEKALDLDPHPQDIPSIYSYLGICLKDMERYEEALSVLEKGKRLDPERTDIHNLIGFCRFKRKEFREAIDAFKEVLRLNPASAIDYANIATNYRELGKKEKAIRYYELALELDPGIEFARTNLEALRR